MDDLITFLNDQYTKDERDVGAPEKNYEGVHSRWGQRRMVAEIAVKRLLLRGHRPGHFAVTWDTDGEPEYQIACVACCVDVNPEIWPCRHIRLLALPYADQAGYREEWRIPLDHPRVGSVEVSGSRPA
ncbi:DUF6221 family protein [Amycolatopsis sp. NPDC049868]|uniref:DUF6221 family protein n=1 Tax=Amycolatopsis sp. NPDC049868 TaxID=3363934 RepID=UPI0037914810